jgi:hypothetical protein
MKALCTLSAFVLLAAVSQADAETPGEPVRSWQFSPSLYLLGSVDDSADIPFGDPPLQIDEPSPAGNIGVGLDFAREASRGRLRGSLFALGRSPVGGSDRSFFGAGRIEASKRFGQGGRLTFSDETKGHLRPELHLSDYWRNTATLGAEWTYPSGRGFGVQIRDRRRSLSELDVLSFSSQSARLGAFFPLGTRNHTEVGVEVQRYSAVTATGRRLVLGGELATFKRAGIATLRLEWFEPFGDRRLEDPNAGQNGQFGFNDVGGAGLFETLALSGDYGALLGDSFFLDPLESDSDEWDFGLRKQVLTAYVSQRLNARLVGSVFVRLQHKHGPNLLVPIESDSGVPLNYGRVAVRTTLRCQIHSRASLLLQGSYLQNWSGRGNPDFSRVLVAFGIQISF